MKATRVLAAVALFALAACGAGDQDPTVTPTSATTGPVGTVTVGPSLPQWLSTAEGALGDLAGAAKGLRTLSPDPADNRDRLLAYADAALRAASQLRSQASPSTGQAETDALTRSIEELQARARAAAECDAGCRPVYTELLSAQQGFAAAFDRVVQLARRPGG